VPAKDADFSLAVEESAALPITAKSAVAKSSKSSGNAQARAGSESIKPTTTPHSPTPETAVKPVSGKPTSSNPVAGKPVAETPSGEIKPIASPAQSEPLTMPASLLPLLDARWFVRPPSGGQYGPATTQMLLDWIAEKRVTADSLLWREGLETWFSARELVPEPFGGQASAQGRVASDIPPPAIAKPMGNTIDPALTNASATATPNALATNPVTLSPSGGASSKAAIAMKKKKQVKQQWMVLGLLATMALCLVVALIVILTRGV